MPDLNARDVEAGDEGHRRHRALDGRGGGGVMAAATARSTATRAAQIDREQAYSPLEAIRMLKGCDGPKFDETVEAHVRLGLNVRHADQQLRGTLMLPHGTGKELRVAVFAEGEKAKEAEEAGADVVGSADLAKKIEEGFDRLRRRDRHARPDGQRRQARPDPRPARHDAEPEDRHGDDGRRQGRAGVEGRQARVPHRPRRERPPADRQEELRRAGSCSRTTRR